MIIITAPAHPVLEETLVKKGYEVLYVPEITYEELSVIISRATGLVVTTRIRVDRKLMDKAPMLKWIGRIGSGMELIDLDYAAQKKIECISTPEGNRNAVAEHVLGLLLNLMNHISKSHTEIKNKNWVREENRGTELTGKTVAIIGYGNTGQAFARLLSCFDVKVLVYDKYKSGFGNGYIKESDMNEVCTEADVVSFHLPLSSETEYFAGNSFFESLKRRPYIINASRGKVVKTSELVYALQHNLIRGAALDVLENEKINALSIEETAELEYLSSQHNVILTPHIAGYSYEAFYKMSEILLQKLGV